MKKITNLFFIILILLTITLGICDNVQAKDAFRYAWQNEDLLIMDEDGATDEDGSAIPLIGISDNNYEFKDTYVTGKLTAKIKDSSIVVYSYLTQYNQSGEVLNILTLNDSIVFSIKSYKDYLYAFTMTNKTTTTTPSGPRGGSTTTTYYEILKIDENMNILNRIDLTEKITIAEDYDSESFFLISFLPKIIGYDNMNIVDEKIVLLYGTTDFIITDLDLTESSLVEYDDTNLTKYFPNLGRVNEYKKVIEESDNEPSISAYLSTDSNEQYIVSSGIYVEHDEIEKASDDYGLFTTEKTTTDGETKEMYNGINGIIELFDNNGQTIWKKETTDYMAYLDSHLIGNYIVTIGVNILLPEDTTNLEIYNMRFNTDIIVYDLNGNIIQKIADGSFYLGLFPTEKGFITTDIKQLNDYLGLLEESNSNSNSGKGIASVADKLLPADAKELVKETTTQEMLIKTNNHVYFLLNNIETKVIGKGNIVANEQSLAGETVVFTVTPEEGHVLGVVKVTDSNGNTIIFTDYTFTMPRADVTIEAVFLPDNPDTTDIAIVSIITIFIIGLAIFISQRKKQTWIKE